MTSHDANGGDVTGDPLGSDDGDDDTSVATPNDAEMEESLDNYIQRLATLEQRLGSGKQLHPASGNTGAASWIR